MAHIEEFGSQRKQVVELNLVPFIDLMSVCIIFLLITAVWTQVSMVQLGFLYLFQENLRGASSAPPFSEVVLRVDVLPEGFRLVAGRERFLIPIPSGRV